MKRNNSEQAFEEARKVIPGGVDSPVRAFQSVQSTPVFVRRGSGAYVKDVDGNIYSDYICSWGPLMLGHASPVYFEGVETVLKNGTTFGLPTTFETKLAQRIKNAVNSIEKLRFVNSGTEAVMSAVRLARGYTGRDKIIKFEGGYHGHADAMLVKSGSGTLTYGKPSSAGVPQATAQDTLTGVYNDSTSVERLFKENAGEIAAVIAEPVAGNMGVIAPEPGFLEALRDLTRENGALLIFDEVITGFRVDYHGYQGLSGIAPDLTTFGKIIGAGMPVGAFGGRAEIMNCLAPEGDVYQAGTLSGNPVAMRMGLNQLAYLESHPEVYTHVRDLAQRFKDGLERAIKKTKIPACVSCTNGMLTLFFTENIPKNFDDVMTCDTALYSRYFNKMLERGFLMPPSQYEGIFLSAAHTAEQIDQTVAAAQAVFEELMRES